MVPSGRWRGEIDPGVSKAHVGVFVGVEIECPALADPSVVERDVLWTKPLRRRLRSQSARRARSPRQPLQPIQWANGVEPSNADYESTLDPSQTESAPAVLPAKGFTDSNYRKILRHAAIMVLIQMLPVVLAGTARDIMMSIGVVAPLAVFVAFVTVDLKRSDFVAATRRMAVLVAIPVAWSALSGAGFYDVMLTVFIAMPIAGLIVFSTLGIFPAPR